MDAPEKASFDLDDADLRVLCLYGRAMLSAQFLELSIFDLAHLERPTPKHMEGALRRLEGLLKQPRKDQARGLGRISESLRERLIEALEVRNRLAHDFLLEYRLNRSVTGSSDWAIEILTAATITFDEVAGELDVVAHETRRSKDIETEVSNDEEAAVFQSLRSWAAAGFPDETPGSA
jgi:hypothetical protein